MESKLGTNAGAPGPVRRLGESWRFIREMVRQPRTVGAILPSGQVMARRMASLIDMASGLPVLELGPGTGAITRAILATGLPAERLFQVEYSGEFARLLAARFPGVHVLQGDAFDLETALGRHNRLRFDTAISGLPLLNFDVAARIRFVEGVLDRLAPGRPLVQFTYGPRAPAPPRGGNYETIRYAHVWRNVPPATLWIYRRGAASGPGGH